MFKTVQYIIENTYTFIRVNEICKKMKNSKFGIMITSEKGCIWNGGVGGGSQDISSVAVRFYSKK